KGLPDEEVIPEIQMNPYYQYFVGLKAFTHQPIFDPSLFVRLKNELEKKFLKNSIMLSSMKCPR
ncbi:transposase, partial [bacterium]|nr:transposase [candidate division CSSED10-310 bacterium]